MCKVSIVTKLINWFYSFFEKRVTAKLGKKEELIVAIELFRNKLEPTGKELELLIELFTKIKAMIATYHFHQLRNLLDVADKEFGSYKYWVNRNQRWNVGDGKNELSNAQRHSGILIDITHDFLVELTGRGDKKYQF